MTRAPVARSAGRSCSNHAAMPGPWSPTAFTMPAAGSGSPGAGFPPHGSGLTDFAVTAPSTLGSPRRATSSPCPNVPDAVSTGLGSCSAPSSTRRSVIRSDLEAELAVAVVLLERADGRLGGLPLHDAGRRRQRRRHGGDARDPPGGGGTADVGAVRAWAPAPRRVHHQVDLARFEQLHRIDTDLGERELADDRVDLETV